MVPVVLVKLLVNFDKTWRRLKPVEECTAPVFLAVDAAPDRPVRIFIDAPAEAPTTTSRAVVEDDVIEAQVRVVEVQRSRADEYQAKKTPHTNFVLRRPA